MGKLQRIYSDSTKKRIQWKRVFKKVFHFLFRVVLLATMVALLTGIVLWLVAIKLFNAQQISESITRQLQRVFNRPVIISSVDLKFFNTLELRGFAVLDSEVQPGRPVLSAESVSVRYQLLPLLEHKVIIDEVTLNKPRFDVLRSENGVYNVPPVKLSETHETYVSSGANRQKFEVAIEDWHIRDGVISYQDQKSGVSHAIYGLDVRLHDLRFDDWSSFRLAAVVRNRWGENVADLAIRGRGKINFSNFNGKNLIN